MNNVDSYVLADTPTDKVLRHVPRSAAFSAFFWDKAALVSWSPCLTLENGD